MGTSFHRVLEEERLDLARSMLAQPGPPILEIAFELGYQDGPAFSKAFKRWTGISPHYYRKVNRAR